MTARDRTGRFTAERTTTTVTERVTIEPAQGPLLPEARARLAAPLPYPAPPVILTPAARAAWAQLTDGLRLGYAADRDDVTQWHAQGRQATFGPLDDWLHHAPLPVMMP